MNDLCVQQHPELLGDHGDSAVRARSSGRLGRWSSLALLTAALALALAFSDGALAGNGFYSMEAKNQPSGSTLQTYFNSWATRVTPSKIQPGDPFTYSVDGDYWSQCTAGCTPCPSSGCAPGTSSDYEITGGVNVGVYKVPAGTTGSDLVEMILNPPWPSPFFLYTGSYAGDARGRVLNGIETFKVQYLYWKPVTVSAAQSAALPVGCYLVGPQPGDVRTYLDSVGRGSGTFASLTVGNTVGCDPGPATIIVSKDTLPDRDPQKFNFEGAVSGTIGDGEQLPPREVEPGTYAVRELPTMGWAVQSVVCNGINYGPVETIQITIDAGETIKCIYTNIRVELVSVTGVYGYAAAFRGPSVTAFGVDGALVTGSRTAIARVGQICFNSHWTATFIRRIPTSLNMLWNGEVGPFTSGDVSLVDRKIDHQSLLLWVSSEIVRYTTCRTPTKTTGALSTARASIGPWTGATAPGTLLVTGAGQMVSLSHSLTVTVHIAGGAPMSVEVPSGSLPRAQQRTQVFTR